MTTTQIQASEIQPGEIGLWHRRNAPQPRPVFVVERLAAKIRVLDLCAGTKRRPVFREIYPVNVTRKAQDAPVATITSIDSIRQAAA